MASDVLRLLGVLAIFNALALLLPVGAEPPMRDAWSYMSSARQLAEHGAAACNATLGAELAGAILFLQQAEPEGREDYGAGAEAFFCLNSF